MAIQGIDTVAAAIETVTAIADTNQFVLNGLGKIEPGFNWPNFVNIITSVCIAMSAMVTAYYAKKGVSSWIEKKVSTEEHDVAVEILTEIYEIVAYMEGTLNSATMYAGQAKMLNETMRKSIPNYVDPWTIPFQNAKEVNRRGNVVNRLICKFRAKNDDVKIQNLHQLLSLTVLEFTAHMGILSGRVKDNYNPNNQDYSTAGLDFSSIQDGQDQLRQKIKQLEMEFEKAYKPHRIQ